MNCICLTNKLIQCRNKASKNGFCYRHIKLCGKLGRSPACTRTELLVPIKKSVRANIWLCCFEGKLAVYKDYISSNEECKILKTIKSENIVTFLDCGPSYIVTPKYDGDLLDLPYNEDLFISSHRQMVNALSILHREFIVHSDIHPKNIFWHKTKRSRVDNIMTFGIIFVLGDFEFSKLFDPFPTTLPKSYGQRIHIIKDELCFLDVREYILVSCKKQNKCKKYITSINDLLNTIPVDYHEDLLQLKRCYFKYDKFKRTEYYEKFIRSFRTFSFEKAFVTKRKELFLAEYLLDYINTWHR